MIAKYGFSIKELALLYQVLLKCLWTEQHYTLNSVRVDDWTAELSIIDDYVGKNKSGKAKLFPCDPKLKTEFNVYITPVVKKYTDKAMWQFISLQCIKINENFRFQFIWLMYGSESVFDTFNADLNFYV